MPLCMCKQAVNEVPLGTRFQLGAFKQCWEDARAHDIIASMLSAPAQCAQPLCVL